MPIYEYQGQQYDIADTDPAVAKNKILNYLASQEKLELPPVEPETGFSAFMPAVKRGALGIQSLLADVAPAMAARVAERFNVPGAGEYAKRQLQEAQEAQEYIQQRYPSAVPSYTDIKSGGDLLTYVVESVGELIPSMIPSVLTGGAAGIAGRGAAIAAKNAAEKASFDAAQKTLVSYSGSKLSQDQLVNLARQEAIKAGQDAAQKVALKYQAAGAIAGSATQNVPEVYQNILEATGKEDLGATLVFGGFNSLLDAITPLALLRKAKGIGLTENELIGAWYKRAGKGVLTGFATEGSTEAVQEMSSAAAEKFVDNNKEFFNKENFERFINAGLKGGIGGGVASGAANIPFGRKEIPPTEAIEPTAAPTTAEEKAVQPATKPKLTDEELEAFLKPKKEEKALDVEETFDMATTGERIATLKADNERIKNKLNAGQYPNKIAIDKANAKLKRQEEEIQKLEAGITQGGQDVTDRTDVTRSGVSAEVLSGSEADRAAAEAAALKRSGVADAGGVTEQAAAREAEQQPSLKNKVIHDKEKDVWSFNDDKELVESAGPLTAIQHKSGIAKEQGINKTYIDNNQVTFEFDDGRSIVVKFNKGKTAVFLNKPDKMMGSRPAESFYENINEIQQDSKTFGLDRLQDFLPPKLAEAIKNTAKAISSDTREIAEADEFIKPFLKNAVDSSGYSALWEEREKGAKKFQEELKGTPSKKAKPEIKEEKPAVVTPPKSAPNLPEEIDPFLKNLIEAEKTRQKGLVKDTRTLEDKAMQVRLAPKTKEQEIQRQQQIKALQAKQAKELAKDVKLTPEQKKSNTAAKNYLAAANNDEAAAFRYLAFDLGVGAKGKKGAYKPGTGGEMAQAFYNSLTPDQKKIVDVERDKWADIEAGTTSNIEARNKAIASRKAKQEKDIKSVAAQITKKEKVAEKEVTEEEKIKTKLQREKDFDEALQESEFGFGIEKPASYSYYDLNRDLYGQASDVYGGTNPDLMGHLLHGNLRAALEEIVSDTSKAFTPFDKEVAKKLLLSKSLPSVSVEPASFIKDLAEANGIKGVPHGVYSNGADHVYLNEATGLNSHILLHEVTHGYTVSLIRAVEKGKVQNAGVKDLTDLYNFLKANNPELAAEYAFDTKDVAEFASEVMSNRNLQDKLRAIPYKRLNAFTEFARAILRLLGIGDNDRSNALAAALISTDRILGTGRSYQETAEFEATMAPYTPKADAEAKAEPEPPAYKEGIPNLDEWAKVIPKIPDSPAASIKKAFGENERYGTLQKLIKITQNDRRAIQLWEKRLEKAGRIIYYGENQNNIFGENSTSAGRAEHNFNFYISNPSKDLYAAIGNYAEARGLSDQDALIELQQIFVSLHEPERRHVKYLLTVPLPLEAAMDRQKIMKIVRSNQITEEQAKKLRLRLEKIVAENKLPEGVKGYSADPNDGLTAMSQDEQSAYYNVVSGIDPKVFEMARQQLYEPNKALIKPIQRAIKAIQDGTKELDTRANYWSQAVNNTVAFYGYNNYVPFKGKPGEKLSKIDEELEPHSSANGREMQEATFAFDGRLSDPDNPLLQTLADGVRSALRSGRGGTVYGMDGNPVLDKNGEPLQFGVTHSIVNAIKQGLIEGKPVETITFEERYDTNKIRKLKEKGENNFFHYKPDGSIEIWAIYNKPLRDAIRRSYRDSNPYLDTFARITSFIGQGHTRYNPAFAPKNFVADTLANAGIIGAELGPTKFGSIVGEVTKNGLGKAFTFSKLYGAKKFDEIERLAKTDDYIKDMYDYVKGGGKVSYVSGLGAQSQFQKMQENLGRSMVATTKDQIDSVLDTFWAEPFELASRVAAYRVTKADFINNQGMNPTEAKTRAIAYVKNLANFEQTGELGKILGSFFVFFRASATGAVRAIDALAPIFVDPNREFLRLPESVRLNEEAKKAFFDNHYKQRRAATAMLTSLFGAGATLYMMALLMSDSDDEGRNRVATDDMDRWTRFVRFPIPGSDKMVQIPWGFGLGAFAAVGAQIASLLVGNSSFGQVLNNIKEIGMDSFLPLPTSKINPYENPAAWAMDSITPSIARPFFEFAMNVDGLGREIYNNRQTRVGDAYTGGDNIPELYKDAARMLANITNGAVDWSPNTMYFFANNYLDGLSRVIHNSYGIGMTVAGKKEFNPKTDTMVLDSFFGTPSNVDAREFSKVENQIKDKERKLNMFKTDPIRYAEYIADHPFDETIVEIYNKGVGGGLNALREQSNMYRKMPDLTPKERKNLVDIIKAQENLYKRHLINTFEAYDIKP